MKNYKTSVLLKTIAYITIPIWILIIIVNAFSLAYYSDFEEDIKQNNDYFHTQIFANDYLSNVDSANMSRNQNLVILGEEQTEVQDDEKIKYNLYYYDNYEILIIRPDGTAVTNIEKTVKTDTVEELKQKILENQYYWIYNENEINTNVEKLTYNNIAYNRVFEDIKEKGNQIYSGVNEEANNRLILYNSGYKLVNKTYMNAPITITISGILLIVSAIYIIISIGHKKGKEGIHTNEFDNIPLEILGIITGLLLLIETLVVGGLFEAVYSVTNTEVLNLIFMLVISTGLAIYATLAVAGVSVIRRIKAKVFLKNTLIYKIIKWLKENTTDVMFKDTSITGKSIMLFGGFIIIQTVLLMLANGNFLFLLVLICFWYYTFKKILEKLNDINKIRKKIKELYNGNSDIKLNEDEFKGESKQVAIELNDISGGLSNAIDEAMKSERLKTELITNVSHDIKTPLTSIINYVDLMKKEDIDNEKIKEYLVILDNKSQRLKKLTEDLVEASKASSGNIKLNIEKLNVKELIKQVSGEFEDKFSKRKLEIIENLPDEDIYIYADSRYMFRVMENMYTNISKYALENSRVYIDVSTKGKYVEIILKNISNDKLNITVDELMQRFVRGDSSRTTEGSGLGISIAKSLTQIQNGKFDIYLDGDLFKVVIKFESI